jgi:hypothetical protein
VVVVVVVVDDDDDDDELGFAPFVGLLAVLNRHLRTVERRRNPLIDEFFSWCAAAAATAQVEFEFDANGVYESQQFRLCRIRRHCAHDCETSCGVTTDNKSKLKYQ